VTPREYIARGLPIFPCHPDGGRLRKTPLTPNGFKDASLDLDVVQRWIERYPTALWGMPSGTVSGRVVLDIDIKRPEANGFDSLEDLGRSILPETPLAHTESGGLHVYFGCLSREVRNSAGRIAPGLDVRANGGYVIVPTQGSGYRWDSCWNPDTVEPIEAPAWLWPPPPARPRISEPPVLQTSGLSPYGEAAINNACEAIVRAGAGQQEMTLNTEAFSIGTLAAAGGVPADIALRALLRAAGSMPDHDLKWPWRSEEIDFKVRRAFADGLRHPREARRVVA
jgi:hypothetical protein